MRAYLFLVILIVSCTTARAQYILDKNGDPVNIYDVINAYQTNVQPYMHHEKDKANKDEKNVEEDGDFLFDRWAWYWKQHTDLNGNLVSPVKTWNEWEAYKAKNSLKNARVTSNSSNWKFQGPDTPSAGDPSAGLGRISAMSFHPTNANSYWIGSDGGGAWKTINNGASWTCMTDNMPSLVVSDVDLNPKNPNTVYICTGDRDLGGWGNHLDRGVGYGIGVLKSYNGGSTWDTTGMTWGPTSAQIANCLLINPIDTNCIILATNTGIFLSLNGGKNWVQKATGHFKQLLYHPTDTNVIYASKYYDASTGASGQILRSANGGNTWTQVTSFSNVLRVGLAVSPADPKVVKALTSSSDVSGNLYGIEGVYNSTDTGHTFTQIYYGNCSNNILDQSSGSGHNCGGQGMYDLMIAIDPTNINNVYVGGINDWYSTDGGSSWSLLTQWNSAASGVPTSDPVVHADKHVAVFHPLRPGRFFECNDGGVFYADNMFAGGTGTTWNNITTGLGITEFYSNAVSDNCQAVLGGAQDNGSFIIVNHSSGGVLGGDGMQSQIDPIDSGTIYVSYQYGQIYRLDAIYSAASFSKISDNIAGPTTTGGWLTPYLLQPQCNNCIIAGYDQVYQSIDHGDNWNSISPVFFPGRFISSLGVTKADSQTIYAVSADSNIIHVTFNLGGSWSTIIADAGKISGIEVDPKDKTHFWITYHGFGVNKVEEFKPLAGWKKLNGNLPDIPVNCIRIDTATRILYIGTDVGVFYKADTGTSWQLYSNGLPVVRLSQLNIKYSTGELWAATYGRGMWSSPKALGVPKAVANVNTGEVTAIVPNPNTGSFNFITSGYYANKRVDMRLIDNTGRTVWSSTGRFDGSGKVLVNTTGLMKGIYFFEAATDNAVIANKKVVVE